MTSAPLAWTYTPNDKGYYINTVAIDKTGSRVITGTFHHNYSKSRRPATQDEDATLGTYCLDALGHVVWKNEFNGFEGIYWTAITPSADFAASCGWYKASPKKGFVFVFDGHSGERKVSFTDTHSRVSICEFSDNSRVLAAAGSDIFIFNQDEYGNFYDTPLTVALPTTGRSNYDAAQGLALDQTGSYVAVGTYQGTILLLKNSGGRAEIVAQFNSGKSVHSIAMNKHGSAFIAGASGGQVHYFQVSDFISSQQPNWSMTLHNDSTHAASVYGVAMDADGNRATAVGNIGDGGIIGLIDVSSESWLWTCKTTHNPNSTSMSADGESITVADGHPDGHPGSFYLFSASRDKPLWVQGTGNMSWPMQISADGTTAVGGSDDGKVYYFSPLRLLDDC